MTVLPKIHMLSGEPVWQYCCGVLVLVPTMYRSIHHIFDIIVARSSSQYEFGLSADMVPGMIGQAGWANDSDDAGDQDDDKEAHHNHSHTHADSLAQHGQAEARDGRTAECDKQVTGPDSVGACLTCHRLCQSVCFRT